MKNVLAIAVLILSLLPTARAQDADGRYVAIYNVIQQADNLASGGQSRDALIAYSEAKTKLENFQKIYPNWDSGIVAYRLSDLEKKISALKAQLSPKPEEIVTIASTNPAVARAQAESSELSVQLQTVRIENQSLQAKLREALTTQPAAVDASELASAQQQLRDLMKQNELLKASATSNRVQKVVIEDTNKISQLQIQLAAAAKKYSEERARAASLVEENAALQKNLARGSSAAASVSVLQSENERLKSQIAALKTASDNAVASSELATRLKDARAQIANLQAAATLTSLEKAALENKVRKLSSELSASAANFDSRIKDLTEQRADLLKKLELANANNSSSNLNVALAQLNALNKEVETLRARIEVDEAKPIPYSAEELALLRQTAPAMESAKHSVRELPPGAAELVASAQRHFASREFDLAELDYKKILEMDPTNALVLANLATIELQQNKLDDAEKHIQLAVDQNPDDAYNLSTLGFLKFRQGKYEDALNALSRAAQIDPSNPEIQNYLGVALSHKGLRQQAETALRKALQLDATYAPAHNNLAVIYLAQNPPMAQLARWHYQKALDAGQPRNTDLEKSLAEKGAPVAAAATEPAVETPAPAPAETPAEPAAETPAPPAEAPAATPPQ